MAVWMTLFLVIRGCDKCIGSLVAEIKVFVMVTEDIEVY